MENIPKQEVRLDLESPTIGDRVEAAPWIWRGRVPSLDGLRAVSIFIVLWVHTAHPYTDAWPQWIRQWGRIGDVGVDCFFVISGFLITLLLIRERQSTHSVSLKRFYIRRIIRIVPAYLVFVLVYGAWVASRSRSFTASEWLLSLTYSNAILDLPRRWQLGHLWSLSVEEHFYFVWPLLFVYLSRRRAAIVVGLYPFIAIAFRMLFLKVIILRIGPPFFTPTRVDTICIGCLLALGATSSIASRMIFSAAQAACIAAFAGIGLILSTFCLRGRWWSYYDNFLYGFVNEILIGVLVWLAITQHASVIGRFLNLKPLMAIGALSYSIYLWQQPFLGPHQPPYLSRLPLNLLAIAVLSLASFFLVERPALRIKGWFEPKVAVL